MQYTFQEHTYIHTVYMYRDLCWTHTKMDNGIGKNFLPTFHSNMVIIMTNITVYAGATGFDLYSNKGAFHSHYNYRTHITQITKLTQHYSGTKQITVGKVSATYYHISSKFSTKLKKNC